MSWTPASPKLTEENFWTEVKAHSIVVVHFLIEGWSQPDRAMSKVLWQVQPEYPTITFFSVDIVEDGAEVATWFAQYTTPALLCFLNGQEHARSMGYLNADALRAKLREWLAAST